MGNYSALYRSTGRPLVEPYSPLKRRNNADAQPDAGAVIDVDVAVLFGRLQGVRRPGRPVHSFLSPYL